MQTKSIDILEFVINVGINISIKGCQEKERKKVIVQYVDREKLYGNKIFNFYISQLFIKLQYEKFKTFESYVWTINK